MQRRLASAFLSIALFILALSAAAGCSAGRWPDTGYQTVAQAPGRDAALARRLNDQAVELLAQGRRAEAEELLRRGLEADVSFGPAHNSLGKVYFQDRKLYLAAWEFQYAIKLMPYLPEPKNNLGLVLEEVGKLDQAVEQYEQAAASAPDNPELLGNLARACMRRGDRDARVRGLLEELVLKDSRPEWAAWAGEQLALMGVPRERTRRVATRPATRTDDFGAEGDARRPIDRTEDMGRGPGGVFDGAGDTPRDPILRPLGPATEPAHD